VSDDTVHAVTFIVRASRDARGRVHGIVERVKTGEKERFTGAEGLGGVIDQMLVRRPHDRADPGSPDDGDRRAGRAGPTRR
jgi:hypothetical protein